jgi:hypothetical protein
MLTAPSSQEMLPIQPLHEPKTEPSVCDEFLKSCAKSAKDCLPIQAGGVGGGYHRPGTDPSGEDSASIQAARCCGQVCGPLSLAAATISCCALFGAINKLAD